MQNSQASSEQVSQEQMPNPIITNSLEDCNSIPENIAANQEELGGRDFESDQQSRRAQTSPLIRNTVDRHGHKEGYLIKQNVEANHLQRRYQSAKNEDKGQDFNQLYLLQILYGQISSQKHMRPFNYERNTNLNRKNKYPLQQQRGKSIELKNQPKYQFQSYNITKGNYYKPELGLKKYSRVNGIMACQKQNSLQKPPNTAKNQHSSNKLNPKKFQATAQHQKFQDLELRTQTKYTFEQFFSTCLCQTSQFTCSRGHQAKYVCASKQCNQNSNICVQADCKGSEQHKECTLKLPIQMFVDELNKNLERQKEIAFEMYYFEEKIIKMIEKNRRILTKRLCFQGSQQNDENYNWRSESRELLNSSKVLQTIDQFYVQKKYDGKRLDAIQKYLKDEKTNVCKILQKTSGMVLKKYNQEQLTHIPSHLVLKKQEVKFVLEQLNFPKEVTLLFRASENEFSLPKYHKICSQEVHTLTIIKTEHQKLIGAYTPIKLTTKLGRDKSNKTFLMSIDLKERLDHIANGESAVYYDNELGPCFGGFYNKRDIEVFQQNGVLFCITDFPSTFNWKKHMMPNQESYRFLTGVSEGKRCRVVDFEVFKIGFREG